MSIANRIRSTVEKARFRLGSKLVGGGDFEYWGRLSDLRNQSPIGDKWLHRGAAQFEYLKELGLSPGQCFLDYGCAVLATAAHVIPYLQAGNYVGIDVASASVAGGARRLSERGIDRKRYHLLRASHPSLPELEGFRFDFIFAASVFQYLRRRDFGTVMIRLRGLLAPGGTFVTTYSVPEQLAELRRKSAQLYGVQDFSEFWGKAELHRPPHWGSRTAVFKKSTVHSNQMKSPRKHEVKA